MSTQQDKAVATANAYNQGVIANLDDAMTRRLIASVVLTESNGGDLDITNSLGYVGRYQAGAGWLADAGFVDKDKLRTAMTRDGFTREAAWGAKGHMTEFLGDPSNWKNNLSLDQYKASAELQDSAFKIISDKAYKQALRDGILNEEDDALKVAGYLKARHISGPVGARKALDGIAVSDDYQTSNIKYLEDITRDGDGLSQRMSHNQNLHSQMQAKLSVKTIETPHVLHHGAHGRDVIELQNHLRDLGYTDTRGRSLEPDGQFGKDTHHAVESFQRNHNLIVDGIAGPNTWTALREAAHAPAVNPDIGPAPPTYSDDTHQQLAFLQAQLREMQRQMEAMERQRTAERERDEARTASNEPAQHAPHYTSTSHTTEQLAYSDPRHPVHPLYADVKQRLEAQGHALPEDRLTQITGELHMRHFQPNWEGHIKVQNDKVFAGDYHPWGGMLTLDLKEPAPPSQETLQQVDTHQEALMQEQALRTQQTQSLGQGHALSR